MTDKVKNSETRKDEGAGKRPLFTQLLFAALAFLAMVVLSYVLVRDIIRRNLVRNAETVILLVQTQIENDLNEPKMNLAAFAQTLKTLIAHNESEGTIRGYFFDVADYLTSSEYPIPSFDGIFGYLETFPEGPVFIENFTWDIPSDYHPTERPWYQNAIDANGGIAETIAYNDIISGDNILIYSICVLDDSGNRLGVAGIRLKIDILGQAIVETAIDRGGWGMLISRELIVLAHINKPFLSIDARAPGFPPHVYVPQMIRGENVSAGSMKDYLGNQSITFFRRLSNGWYLGLVTPEGPFYQSLTTLAFILGSLGAAFATVLIIILIRIDKAKNKSDRESRHKSAFLANMSHEIRTPMNAIIGMTTIGKSAAEIGRKDYCFTKIEDASNHLLGVINDILDMSKIEANKLELSPAEFSFEKMLQRVVNVVNFRVDEKHQKFTVHIDKNIPRYLIGDDQRIAQVITNLLGNAIKFTPEKGTISLNTSFVGEDNGVCQIQISVSDTGIGLSEEQQKRIFMSFEQAESSTTRKYGGTGLGLAISRSIVEMMGGAIWVESEVSKGSTFTFTIYAARGTQVNEGLLGRDVNFSNLRVMAVDDDKDILDYFVEIAESFGITNCATALSGEEALGLVVRNGDYHIYFVDWRMPVMDGIQLAAEIKRRTSGKSVVIMISAAEWTSIEADAIKAGVDKFLSKPLFPSDILNVIQECMSIDRKQIKEDQDNIDGIFAGKHILLVEDVDINREIVQTLLEPTQLEIDCAENGLEAVQMFSKAPGKYDMILMDVQMPEMDGYEATRQIRQMKVPEGKLVRIVAMTANVFRDDIERCLEAGMNDHIGKPVDFNELIEKLRILMPPQQGKSNSITTLSL
ncbi:MAG: response regulator [Treponema sp.]|jgi:signal transduction histidine kinase/DNA-binding response OmpR family regulator|nr:response regulator [Treponema sp.]